MNHGTHACLTFDKAVRLASGGMMHSEREDIAAWS